MSKGLNGMREKMPPKDTAGKEAPRLEGRALSLTRLCLGWSELRLNF